MIGPAGERPHARDEQRTDAHQPTEHSSYDRSGGASRGRTFRRLGGLDRADVTNISQVLRGQDEISDPRKFASLSACTASSTP